MSHTEYGLPDEMSLQAVYDKVVTHLIRQGRPSQKIDPDFGEPKCLYRGPDDTACAVGCLISDDDYFGDLEDHSAEALLNPHRHSVLFKGRPRLFPEALLNSQAFGDMLKDLQVIHDNATLDAKGRFSMPELRAHLQRVGDRFGLSLAACYALPAEDEL